LDNSAADYERLVRPLEDRMIQSVWKIVRNADSADDALQCALTTLWQKWDKLQRHANPEALIMRVCIDAAYDQLRKNLRRERLNRSKAGMDADAAIEPSRQIEHQETEREILRAIAALPGKQRAATFLRLVEGCSYETVAAALGCGEATARKHVARGRRSLQATLAHLAPTNAKGSEP
jgi:RNA polymerase sigma factor (sigma-70 family)